MRFSLIYQRVIPSNATCHCFTIPSEWMQKTLTSGEIRNEICHHRTQELSSKHCTVDGDKRPLFKQPPQTWMNIVHWKLYSPPSPPPQVEVNEAHLLSVCSCFILSCASSPFACFSALIACCNKYRKSVSWHRAARSSPFNASTSSSVLKSLPQAHHLN